MPAETTSHRYRVPVLVLIVFMPFAGGFFLSYLFRSVNAIIAPQLAADLGLDPADLGFLTSVYFMTFAACQLPLGVALDRFGPRRVQASLLMLAALGADESEVAIVNGAVRTVRSVCEFLVLPMLGVCSDVVGRKAIVPPISLRN